MLTLKEERELVAVAQEALQVAEAAMKTIVADRKKSLPSSYYDTCSNLSRIWSHITSALRSIDHNHSVKPLTLTQKTVLRRIARKKKKGEEQIAGTKWDLYNALMQHGFLISRTVEKGRGARTRYLVRYTATGRGRKYLEAL